MTTHNFDTPKLNLADFRSEEIISETYVHHEASENVVLEHDPHSPAPDELIYVDTAPDWGGEQRLEGGAGLADGGEGGRVTETCSSPVETAELHQAVGAAPGLELNVGTNSESEKTAEPTSPALARVEPTCDLAAPDAEVGAKSDGGVDPRDVGLAVSASHTGERGLIDTSEGDLDQLYARVVDVLRATGNVYVQGKQLVTVGPGPSGSPVIRVLTPPLLRRLLSTLVVWMVAAKQDEGLKALPAPPMAFCKEFLQLEDYSGVPRLQKMVYQPFLRAGGSLCGVPGYDRQSELYGAFEAAAASVPERPTLEQAKDALAELLGVINEFAFADPQQDQSAAISAMLTACVRQSLDAAPMFVVAAPVAGTGKTLLCEMLGILASACPVFPMPLPGSNKECEKVLHALLKTSPEVVFFDNITGTIPAYDKLCTVLTSSASAGRDLGGSAMTGYSTKALFLATGNNVRPHTDMSRRCVTIHLDARSEMPASRVFRRADLLGYVRERRAKVIGNALTIVLAWLQAGRPALNEMRPLNSFAAWSAWCRAPLIWLGLPDPAKSAFESMEGDEDKQLLGALLKTWHSIFGERPTKVGQAVLHAQGEPRDEDDGLRGLLLDISESSGFNERRIGRWLLRHESARAGGLRLVKSAKRGNASYWVVAPS